MLTSGYFKGCDKYKVGPGGPYCNCCTKMIPSIMKVRFKRALRRKEKISLRKELVEA